MENSTRRIAGLWRKLASVACQSARPNMAIHVLEHALAHSLATFKRPFKGAPVGEHIHAIAIVLSLVKYALGEGGKCGQMCRLLMRRRELK